MPTRAATHDAALRAFREVSNYQGACRPTNLAADTATDTTGPHEFFLALRSGGFHHMTFTPDDGSPTQTWLADRAGSWTCHTTNEDGTHAVRQGGPSRLWDSIEAAHNEWRQLGKPARERFGLTIEPDGTHTLWLDEPYGHYTWTLA